jgi:hypothetical protein
MKENLAIEKFMRAQESLVIQQSDFSLKTINEMVSNGAINITPHYQRRERWHISKQSALIESFILNVPVPPVYLSEDDYGIYSVIDGKQRITSINNYLKDEFKLRDLEKFPELNGLLFSELPQKIKNALSIRPYLRVVTLLRQSDPNLKYEVFLRLNTGGEPLMPQEIRNVAYSGSLNDLLYELSSNEFLKFKLKIIDKKSTAFKNMEDLEHILRFFTLYENWTTIGGVLAREMDKYMAINRVASESKINELRVTFLQSIKICENFWGQFAFNKPITGAWREQLISPLYDAQMVAVALLIKENKIKRILAKKNMIEQRTRKLYEDDQDFYKAVSQATNNPRNIQLRIRKMYDMLNELAQD